MNVPGQIKQLYPEANITAQGGAWALDALDPLFAKLSDAYAACNDLHPAAAQ